MSINISVSTTEDVVDIIATPTVNIVNVTNSASINPGLYDLSQFTNTSVNPFVRTSGLSSYVPTSRTLTINGLTQDLSVNRSWTVTASAVWGGITGTLSAQTDLQSALNAKEPTITAGTISQYWRGDKTWQTFPTIPTVTPSALTKTDDTNVTLTLGGTPSTALLQGVSLTLGWTGTLADSRIASAATWNAKQDLLLSGTNIKTINGSSVLGSGDFAVQPTLTLTTTGTSGAATLVGATLNIPQYSGGSANPSVIVSYATDGTTVTGTLNETISRSLLIPANTFTSDGMLEVVGRVLKTGALAGQSFRIYKNTSNSLTGATLIGLVLSVSTQAYAQAIRTFRISANTLTGLTTSTATSVDYAQNGNPEVSTTFTTSVDNYIIFAIQLAGTSDSSVVRMARAVKYI